MSEQSTFRVLVVDDDRSTLMLVSRYLKKSSYQLTLASTGEQAWQLIQQAPPDLVVSDWNMAGISGIDLCRLVKAQFKLCYFILLSSHSQMEKRVHALEAGADEFLAKPIDQEELRARVQAGLRLTQLSRDLAQKNRRLEQELQAAARYVRSQLPQPLAGPVQTEWRFQPSGELGGDCFDYFWLDSDHLLLYLIDVSGHGIGPALLSMSVLHLLRSRGLRADLTDPSCTVNALNCAYDMSDHSDFYFTLWYGVYQPSTRQLAYAGGGHPPAILCVEGTVLPLAAEGFPIGMMAGATFPVGHQTVAPGSVLYLFSDGAYEISTPEGIWWSREAFIQKLTTGGLDPAVSEALRLRGSDTLEDDLCILQITFD